MLVGWKRLPSTGWNNGGSRKRGENTAATLAKSKSKEVYTLDLLINRYYIRHALEVGTAKKFLSNNQKLCMCVMECLHNPLHIKQVRKNLLFVITNCSYFANESLTSAMWYFPSTTIWI